MQQLMYERMEGLIPCQAGRDPNLTGSWVREPRPVLPGRGNCFNEDVLMTQPEDRRELYTGGTPPCPWAP